MQSTINFDKNFGEAANQIDQIQKAWQQNSMDKNEAINKIQILHGKLILLANKKIQQLSNEVHISSRDEINISEISCLISALTYKVTEILHIIRNNTVHNAYLIQKDIDYVGRLGDEFKTLNIMSGGAPMPSRKPSVEPTQGIPESDTLVADDFSELVIGNFDINKFDENEPVLLNYWADWCGFSKRLMSYWPQVVKTLEQKYPNLQIISMNARKGSSIEKQAMDAGVEGFPTLLLKVKEKTYELNGAKPEEEIVAFIKEYYPKV
jgi:thiol-disulfide isomerase/thioredoxin